MKKITVLIIGLLIGIKANSQQQKKIEFETYENRAITNVILEILNEDYNSGFIQKFDTKDLYNDSSLLKSFPKDYFSSLIIDSLRKITATDQLKILKTLKNKSNYLSGKYNKNGSISYYPCKEPQRYDILISLSGNKDIILKMLFSSDSHRFCMFYQSDRTIFILYDSCLNDSGWQLLNASFKEIF